MSRRLKNQVGIPTTSEKQQTATPANEDCARPDLIALAKKAWDAHAAAKSDLEAATKRVANHKYATAEEVGRAAASLLYLGAPLRGLSQHNPDHASAILASFYDHWRRYCSGGNLIDQGTIIVALDKVAGDDEREPALSAAIQAYCRAADMDTAVSLLYSVLDKYRTRSLKVPSSLIQFCREQKCRLLHRLWSAEAVTPTEVAKDLEALARTDLDAALQAAGHLVGQGQALSKLDLSRLLNLAHSRDDDYRRFRPSDSAGHHLLKILAADPGISGHDVAVNALADRALASDDVELLVSFARQFRTVRAAEFRAAIVKAVSGPPVDAIVDAIIERGYPPYAMRRMMMMPPPWMFFGADPFG